jgi:glycosyltransferase involved in cell wall biosynthesis
MKLCCTVSTYNRPHLLPRIIKCFEEQDYDDRYMVILDDGGQYENQCGDRWSLVSVSSRFPSLGDKRNAVLDMVPSDTYAVLPTDDDDLFLPWHLSAAANALAISDWSRPSVVISPMMLGDVTVFRQNYTGHRDDNTTNRLYHPAWAMKLSCVFACGGYPSGLSGPEDQGLMRKLEDAGVSQADPVELGFAPSYVYCWGNNNISGLLNKNDRLGADAWKRLGKHLDRATLDKWTPPFDLRNPMVAPFIENRPF